MPFQVFIDMESRITTKKAIEKAHFITSSFPSNLYPLDVLELMLELLPEDIGSWNKKEIDTLQNKIIENANKNFYKKLLYMVRTIEVDDEEDNQLLTLRFIFFGSIKKDDAEKLGVLFRNIVERDYNGTPTMKFNQMGKLDLLLTITPLQFTNSNKNLKRFLNDEMLSLIIERPMLATPRLYFINDLHTVDSQ